MSSFIPFQKLEHQKQLKRNYYDSLQLKQHITIQKKLSLQRAQAFFQKNNQ
jgi:hypothetical protein